MVAPNSKELPERGGCKGRLPHMTTGFLESTFLGQVVAFFAPQQEQLSSRPDHHPLSKALLFLSVGITTS